MQQKMKEEGMRSNRSTKRKSKSPIKKRTVDNRSDECITNRSLTDMHEVSKQNTLMLLKMEKQELKKRMKEKKGL